MPDLSAIARERVALATIADAIVTAGFGRGLRVAVACPDSHLAVVGHLTRALQARGRACRWFAAKLDPVGADGSPSNRPEDGSTVVVITSGVIAEADRGVQRVDIRVTAGAPAAGPGHASYQQTSEAQSAADREPDIILDYRDPDGPMIRYIAPHLSSRDPR